MILKIKNFQGHVDSELDLVSPGINAIRGPSDTGKSSIIRAIEALANGGTMDRRKGSKETEVEWRGCKRVRSSSKNQYEVDGEVYKAMRSTRPNELVNRLRLENINFRSQHQPYFLLNDSSGAVAREMNRLADLGMIDYVSSKLKAEVRSFREKLGAVDDEIEAKKEKVASLNWVDAAVTHLEEIERLGRRAEECLHHSTEVGRLLQGVVEADARIGAFPPTDRSWLQTLQTGISATDTGSIGEILNEVKEYQQVLSVCPDIVADLKKIQGLRLPELDELGPILIELEGLKDYSMLEGWMSEKVFTVSAGLSALVDEIEALEDLLDAIDAVDEKEQLLTSNCHELEEQLEELRVQAGICPTCGRPYES